MGGWSELPPELLEVICDGLEDLCDIRRVRSVCRSWRSFFPNPPNRISQLFPHRISVPSPPFASPENQHRPIDIISKCVYLLRSDTFPSKTWLVSMEEANPGILRVRHPITNDTYLDLPPVEKLSELLSGWNATEIARSHSFCFADCSRRVLGSESTGKLVMVSGNPNRIQGNLIQDLSTSAVVLHSGYTRLSWFRVMSQLQLVEELPTKSDDIDHEYAKCNSIHDIVNFKGCIWAVDVKGRVFIVDHQNSRLTRIDDPRYSLPQWVFHHGRKPLVESQGDLYLVSVFMYHSPTTCVLYKLAMNDNKLYKWDKLDDLGDRVFFIAPDSSYSISTSHLPFPWTRNCIVFHKLGLFFAANNIQDEILVFHLRGRLTPLSSYPSYFHLFNPFPSSSTATGMELRPNKKSRLQSE